MSAALLTDLQDAFCREYVVDRNATRAYARACVALGRTAAKSGPVTASRWLNLPKIARRIEELVAASADRVAEAIAREEHAEEVEKLQDYVLRRLRDNVERAMQAEPVTRNGIPTGEWKYDGATANKALELLGKTVGMFKEVSETRDLTLEATLRTLAEEELAA